MEKGLARVVLGAVGGVMLFSAMGCASVFEDKLGRDYQRCGEYEGDGKCDFAYSCNVKNQRVKQSVFRPNEPMVVVTYWKGCEGKTVKFRLRNNVGAILKEDRFPIESKNCLIPQSYNFDIEGVDFRDIRYRELQVELILDGRKVGLIPIEVGE